MGVDPTMKLLLPVKDAPPRYDITVRLSPQKSVVYRTRELIDQESASSLCGRGTRVWDVALVDGGVVKHDEGGVLEDYWVDADRMREREILDQIRQSGLDSELQTALDTYLLTVVAQGDVFVGDDVDNTRQVMTRGVPPSEVSRFNLRLPLCSTETSNSQKTRDSVLLQLRDRNGSKLRKGDRLSC